MSSARSRARRLAVQGLYEWQITGTGIAEIKQRFLEGKEARKIDEDYFRELIEGVINQVVELDQHITPFLNRSLQEVDEVEKAILRLATYELAHRPDIPYRVIINEGVELAKTTRGVLVRSATTDASQDLRRRAGAQVYQRHAGQDCRQVTSC